MSAYDATANELMRRLREMWIADIDAILANIDPGLLSGRIGLGLLPRGTMVMRGAYDSAGRYRTGDLVTSGGSAYLAVASSVGQDVTDLTYFIPLAGTSSSEALYWDGAPLTFDGDGLYWG